MSYLGELYSTSYLILIWQFSKIITIANFNIAKSVYFANALPCMPAGRKIMQMSWRCTREHGYLYPLSNSSPTALGASTASGSLVFSLIKNRGVLPCKVNSGRDVNGDLSTNLILANHEGRLLRQVKFPSIKRAARYSILVFFLGF